MQERRYLELEETKKVLLGIMDDVDAFCKEYDITYSLAYGTLIGAVRHKGFIPWDDDIDIIMKRKDYEVFCREYPKKEHGYYKLIDLNVEKDWIKPFAKVYDTRTEIAPTWLQDKYPKVGVAVDIFPLDEVQTEEGKTELLKKQKKMKMLLDLRVSKPKPSMTWLKYIVKRILYRFIAVLSVQRFTGKMEELAKAYGGNGAKYMGCVAYPFDDEREVMPVEWFGEYVELQFEDKTYMALKYFDEYLTHIFGDYMKLPPEEDRVNHQDKERAYWV